MTAEPTDRDGRDANTEPQLAGSDDGLDVAGRLLIDIATLARLLSLSESTLHKLKLMDQLPAPVRIGRAVRWNLEEIRAWVNCGCPARHRWEIMRQQHGFTSPAGVRSANRSRGR